MGVSQRVTSCTFTARGKRESAEDRKNRDF